MRYRKVRTALHWISTFVNVTLHCCAPAHAEDINGLSVVATVPDHETSLDHAGPPARLRRGMQPSVSMTDRSGRKVIGIWQTAF
jgi:hypothetical protein